MAYSRSHGKYLPLVSARKRNDQWLRNGVLPKRAVLRAQNPAVKDFARQIRSVAQAETLLKEMKHLGWVKAYVLNDTPAAQDFTTFLSTFWDWEKSPYIKEKQRKNHGIHRAHCIRQGQAVALYWESFFKGRLLGDISATDIDAFINYMGDKPISAARKNVVILAGTKPLRWAFSKGKIEKDPTRGHILFSGEERKRQILSPAVAAAAFRVEWKNERAKLANMLAAVTGMRQGEILALRFQDLGNDCLHVRCSWGKADGLKLPKNNECRTVELPFPDLLHDLGEQVKNNPWGVSPESFIFWSKNKADVPMHGKIFVVGLRDALAKTGFSKEEAGKYLFHGWRHFFTSYMMGKLDKKLLKSQTGHRTDAMLSHYGEHRTEGDREIIQIKKKEAFAGLLPERTIEKCSIIP